MNASIFVFLFLVWFFAVGCGFYVGDGRGAAIGIYVYGADRGAKGEGLKIAII